MNQKSFIEAIDDETLAKMIDKTLKYEKRNKIERVKSNMFKTIPVAAVIALFFGVINLPIFPSFNNDSAINLADSSISVTNDDGTVTTEINDLNGKLIITTPKGQEPIQNKDGTITLPGGGTYIRTYSGDKVTVLSGSIIDKYGNINLAFPANTGKKIIYETANGDIFITDEKGLEAKIPIEPVEPVEPIEAVEPEIQLEPEMPIVIPETMESEILNGFVRSTTVLYSIHKVVLYDGTIITVPVGNITEIAAISNSGKVAIEGGRCTITLTNLTKIIGFNNAIVSGNVTKNEVKIKISDGDATIIQPDGTISTVPAGTLLDKEGNIIN